MQISAHFKRFLALRDRFSLSRLNEFLRCESGATTADWAVGSAAVVSMAVGMVTETSTATTGLASDTGSYIAEQNFNVKSNNNSDGGGSQDYASNDYGNDDYNDWVSPGTGGSSSSGGSGATAGAGAAPAGGSTGGEGEQAGGGDQSTGTEGASEGEGDTAGNDQTSPDETAPSGEGDPDAPATDGDQPASGDDTASSGDGDGSSGDGSGAETAELPLPADCYRNNGTIRKRCL